jgi:broad specificity polyphosphatase/5'/3'-nucleotidase SurE
LTADEPVPDPQKPSDLGALADGWVTVTPLQFDLTAREQLIAWQGLW